MSDPAPQHDLAPAPPVPRKRLWRRLLWSAALSLAVALVFYQPIGTWVLERLVVGIARQANVGLRLKVGGNLISHLTIEGLHGEAIGETPVKELSVARAEFRYSFPRMLRYGVADFLSSYELRNATVEIDELPEEASEDARTQAQRLTDLLRDILQQPALFSNRVELENVNVRLNLIDGPIRMDSIHILLDPQEKGFIRVGRVSLPRLPEWHQINAEATYNGRRLVIDRLELGEKMSVVHAELIPARVTGAEDMLTAKLALFGGEVNIDLRSEGKNASLVLDGRDIPVTEVSRHFGLQPSLEGRLETLAVSMKGESEDPSTWDGQFALRVSGMAVDDFRAGDIQLHAALEDGQFRMHDSRIVSGKNELTLEGEQAFPGSFTELVNQGLALRYKLRAPEMQAWSPSLPAGALEAEGSAMAGREKIAFSTQARLTDWRLLEGEETKLTLSAAEVKGEVTLALSERGENAPWFAGLTSDLAFQTTPGEGSIGVAEQSIALDRVALELRQSGSEVTLRSLTLERKENRIALEGRAKLPVALEPLKAWEELEFDAAFAIHAPSLEDFNGTGAAQDLKGKLEGEGKFRRAAGKMAGEGKLEASELGWREFEVRQLTLNLPLEEARLPEATLRMEINDTDRLEATISADLAAPYAYDIALTGQISDLGIFTPFAGRPLGGALRVNWHATGRFDALEHRGEGAISLTDGLVDLHHPLNAEIAVRYSPEEIVIGQLKASAPQGSLSATARWAEQRMTVNDLTLQAGEHGSATGHLSLPLDLRTPKDIASLLPETGALEGAFVVRQIDLAKVVPSAPPPKPEPKKRSRKKAPPPKPTGVEGLVDATLALGGTMASPELTLEVKGRKLRSRAAEKLAAADVDAAVTLKEKVLKLKGEARTPNVQPLRFEGEVPLDVRRVIADGALDPSTPVSASVVLPSSSAAVLRNFSPAIRYIDGTLRLDAAVKGTVGKPVFSGGAHFDLPAIRMTNTSIPGINRFRGDLLFSGDRLTVQRFGGDVAGGPFELSGDVGLKEWSAPQLNLRLKSTGTLLVRNDTLTVRTDTNLKVAGPLQSAEVKGKVTLRKSRFYRDVEILPLALPGKPVPVPVETTTEVSIDVPPVRDWKFNIAVKTKEPFLIRSNMARGAATVDLRVGGTGLSPTLDGTVRLENLVASLPFSRLTIEQGFVRFNPADSFNPALDIHGSSPVRGTMVHAHIYGTASEPETIFTSEPPLPQEEIIALLATGATTQGLAENNQVMAGRAGSLLLQDLYRKVTRQRPQKKKLATAGDDPLGDRFSLDVGTVDPRTGRQEVGGRFRLNEEFELGGGLDIEGDVRVQLRYLLRFR